MDLKGTSLPPIVFESRCAGFCVTTAPLTILSIITLLWAILVHAQVTKLKPLTMYTVLAIYAISTCNLTTFLLIIKAT